MFCAGNTKRAGLVVMGSQQGDHQCAKYADCQVSLLLGMSYAAQRSATLTIT